LKFEKITCQKSNQTFGAASYKLVEIASDEEDMPVSRKGKRQPKYKKVKSLGSFCQQFIHLFVGWKPVISLEEAARQISSDEIDEKMLKTKIRRLYDIANVLQSIGLIKKTHMSTNRKPAFRWIGIQGVYRAIEEILKVVAANENPQTALFYEQEKASANRKLGSQVDNFS